MDNKPKRRKSKDNPYTINYCSKTNKYTVSFEDIQGVFHYIDITQAVYHALNLFELKDISQMHEYERHIEHSKLTEITLHNRAKDKPLEVDKEV